MEWVKKILTAKTARIVLLVVGVVALLVLIKGAFFSEEKDASRSETEEEVRLSNILQEMDGVDAVDVLISRTEGAVNAVVVYRGEDSLMTRVQIADVVGNVLQTERKNVSVYFTGNK